ncbi:hypothetical protein [Streptomyces lincolnensis]|uniref:hypothetical protein n=1 Tax=Streptomyces lincolnensis TaxID=1915 RepID=UPI00082C7E48|nr:hypothetical protein [Streptomyces lincolnensis]QMV08024.1 hypothetical protein GJU35_21775 [Streptomyces lincolnensis]
MLERTSTTGRYARSLIAAVIAVSALVLAANAGPARATEVHPAEGTTQTHRVTGTASDQHSVSGRHPASVRPAGM